MMTRRTKRFSKRARIWVRFSDDTSESFTVPVQLVFRIAPTVAWHFEHADVWVESGATIIRTDETITDRHDRCRYFGSRLQRQFGGMPSDPEACAVCAAWIDNAAGKAVA